MGQAVLGSRGAAGDADKEGGRLAAGNKLAVAAHEEPRELTAGPEVVVAMGHAWPDVLAHVSADASAAGSGGDGCLLQATACALAWRAGKP
jgi:hypothetical protein